MIVEYTIRLAVPAETEDVIKFAAGFKAIKDFGYNWKRWGNFEKHPPVIALNADKGVIGLHAATSSARSGYVNSYYLAVATESHGQGLAAKMIGFTIMNAHPPETNRIKFKAHFDSPGNEFWQGLGARPFGRDDVQFLYDMHLWPGSHMLDATVTWWKYHQGEHEPIPESAMKRYQKAGVIFL